MGSDLPPLARRQGGARLGQGRCRRPGKLEGQRRESEEAPGEAGGEGEEESGFGSAVWGRRGERRGRRETARRGAGRGRLAGSVRAPEEVGGSGYRPGGG